MREHVVHRVDAVHKIITVIFKGERLGVCLYEQSRIELELEQVCACSVELPLRKVAAIHGKPTFSQFCKVPTLPATQIQALGSRMNLIVSQGSFDELDLLA